MYFWPLRKESVHSRNLAVRPGTKLSENILTPVSTWHTPNAPVVSRKDIMFLIKE
jgi:hypothetical protein